MKCPLPPAAAAATTLLFLLPAGPARGQTATEALQPFRTDTAPVIDGNLEDEVWQQAPSEDGFRTWRPDFGQPASERTVVWFAYDRENLYFAFRCYDREPDMVKRSVSARDRILSDDWVCINLDSFNDKQSLYAFYINPLGIQADTRATVVSEDAGVDVVWYSSGRVDEEGWTVEVRIPFKSIRYTNREPVQMGVIFERFISRKSEGATFPALDPRMGVDYPAWLSQMRPLQFSGIRRYRLLEFLPAVTWSENSSDRAGDMTSAGGVSAMSLTAKLGITSNLILDGAANPDFSQVESDAGQVDFNQRFALYYPEKRPFFLEGRESFLFGGSAEGDPLGAVVHTRTIIDPSVGLKLSGKAGDRNTFSAVYAEDHLPAELGQGERAWFSILRYKRAMTNDGYLGGFYTSRELTSGGANRVGGADGQLRLSRSSIVGFHAFLSQTTDQRSALVPSPERRDGHALGFQYTFNNRNWLVDFRANDLTGDFETQTGYLTRVGMSRYRFGVLRMFYPGSELVHRLDSLVHLIAVRDHPSGLWESLAAFDLRLNLARSSMMQAGYEFSDEIFLGQRFGTGGVRLRLSSQYTRRLYLSAYFRHGEKVRYAATPFQARGTDVSTSAAFEPSEHFRTVFSIAYSDLYRDEHNTKIFDYTILRSHNTYQLNRYLFFRAIAEYNDFYRELQTDFLVSFTYIPGTVVHIGYGSLYNRLRWDEGAMDYVRDDGFMETRRGIFFKTSFLWRL